MAEDPKLASARRDAELARERLLASAHTLQARVAPARLADDALATVRERGTAAFDTLNGAARRRPGVAAGIAAGIAALLLRRPIGRFFRRRRTRKPLPAQPRIAARPRTGDHG